MNFDMNMAAFSAIFENDTYCIIVKRFSDGVYCAVNRGFLHMSGLTEEQVIGKTQDELSFRFPELIQKRIDDSLRDNGAVENLLTWATGFDGIQTVVFYSAVIVNIENIPHVVSVTIDLSRHYNADEIVSLDEMCIQSLFRISHYNLSSISDLLDFALDEVIKLSSSEFGYIFYYDEEREIFTVHAWSGTTKPACAIADPALKYELKSAGIWGEAVRQRRPIVINDFCAPNPLKRGFPEGHIPITRFMTIPVFVDEKIVAVVGVANKDSDYTAADVRQLILMMDSVWKIVMRRKADDALALSEERYRGIVVNSPLAIFQTSLEGEFYSINPAMVKLLKCDSEEDVKEHYRDIANTLYTFPEKRTEMLDMVSKSDGFINTQAEFRCKDQSIITVNLYAKAYRDEYGIKYLEGFIEDITERVALEREKNALEEHKRVFYRNTILSVTNGKLEICDADTIEPYIAKAECTASVMSPLDAKNVRHQVEDFCRKAGMDEQSVSGYIIGVGEAITNSIKHAERGTVCMGANGSEIWISISDHGSGIDSLLLPSAVLQRGFSTKPSMGLGYSIMMDSADQILLKTDNFGTTVVLIKCLLTQVDPYASIFSLWDNLE